MTIKIHTSMYMILIQVSLCLSSRRSLYPLLFPKPCFLNSENNLVNSDSENVFFSAIWRRICKIASCSLRLDSAHSCLTVSLWNSFCIFLGGGAVLSTFSNWDRRDVFIFCTPISLIILQNWSWYLWFVSSLNWKMYWSSFSKNNLSEW